MSGDFFVGGIIFGIILGILVSILLVVAMNVDNTRVEYTTLNEVCKEITGNPSSEFYKIGTEGRIECKINKEEIKIFDSGKIVLIKGDD